MTIGKSNKKSKLPMRPLRRLHALDATLLPARIEQKLSIPYLQEVSGRALGHASEGDDAQKRS
jgi:hypothetical protein